MWFCSAYHTLLRLLYKLLCWWAGNAVLYCWRGVNRLGTKSGTLLQYSGINSRREFIIEHVNTCWCWCADVNNGYRTPDFSRHLTGYDYELYCADNPITNKGFCCLAWEKCCFCLQLLCRTPLYLLADTAGCTVGGPACFLFFFISFQSCKLLQYYQASVCLSVRVNKKLAE